MNRPGVLAPVRPGREADEGSECEGGTSRFAVDRSLGRLARWLRVLGWDATCRPDLDGHGLLVLAAREGRIVLTRERPLARRAGRARVVVIAVDRFRDQLAELRSGGLLPEAVGDPRPPRCGDCNVAVERVDRAALPASVPARVRETQSDFRRCPRCRRVFWPGGHAARMRVEVGRLGIVGSWLDAVEASA